MAARTGPSRGKKQILSLPSAFINPALDDELRSRYGLSLYSFGRIIAELAFASYYIDNGRVTLIPRKLILNIPTIDLADLIEDNEKLRRMDLKIARRYERLVIGKGYDISDTELHLYKFLLKNRDSLIAVLRYIKSPRRRGRARNELTLIVSILAEHICRHRPHKKMGITYWQFIERVLGFYWSKLKGYQFYRPFDPGPVDMKTGLPNLDLDDYKIRYYRNKKDWQAIYDRISVRVEGPLDGIFFQPDGVRYTDTVKDLAYMGPRSESLRLPLIQFPDKTFLLGPHPSYSAIGVK